jgi:hypothetical protein
MKGLHVKSDVPDWVRTANQRWGRQKRRIWAGMDWYLNPQGQRQQHVDGYAESFLGRILEEKVSAGQAGPARQKWAEVYWGEGLDVARVIPGLPEMPYAVLHLHYVFDPDFGLTVSRKARLLSIDRTTYGEHLARAEFWIWGRLEPTVQDTQLTERVQKIVREALTQDLIPVTNSQTG